MPPPSRSIRISASAPLWASSKWPVANGLAVAVRVGHAGQEVAHPQHVAPPLPVVKSRIVNEVIGRKEMESRTMSDEEGSLPSVISKDWR